MIMICYDFVIDIESVAIETWGALTFHDYCLLIAAIDCRECTEDLLTDP